MNAVTCPFCGVVSEVRHETQQACIQALRAEIVHTRRVLEQTTETASPSTEEDQDRQLT